MEKLPTDEWTEIYLKYYKIENIQEDRSGQDAEDAGNTY
jgi:hypothetical protein